MKPAPECFSCFLKQALIASRLAHAKEARQTKVQKAVLRLLDAIDWRENPPYIATRVFQKAYRTLRCADPYRGVKTEYNKRVKTLFPYLRARLKSSRDPFATAVKFALAGNIIDFGILEKFDLEGTLHKTLRISLPGGPLRRFKQKIGEARTILYVADNAGEIGFDYFLISAIRALNPSAAIHLCVKSKPIINDATATDARYFSLERLTSSFVSAGAWVGTHPRRASRAFKNIFAETDCIISKGQANWESLEELKDPRITFLLRAKCPVVAAALNVPLNSPAIA